MLKLNGLSFTDLLYKIDEQISNAINSKEDYVISTKVDGVRIDTAHTSLNGEVLMALEDYERHNIPNILGNVYLTIEQLNCIEDYFSEMQDYYYSKNFELDHIIIYSEKKKMYIQFDLIDRESKPIESWRYEI